MAEQPEISNNEDGARELRGKLIGRLVVAGVLVALLLGALAFFDYLANPPEDDEPVFTQRVPVGPKKEMSQPVKPAENLPEPPAAEQSEPPVEPPPPPEVEAKPAAMPEKRPAEPSTAAVAKPAPVQPAPQVPVVPEATTAPSNVVAPPESAPAKPAARIAEQKPAAAAAPPSVRRLFSGFLLQAGVFSSIQRAEELHARLTLSGVPSTLETRVQVGPFRTKREAEAAQAKLRELGVETILVPPKGKN